MIENANYELEPQLIAEIDAFVRKNLAVSEEYHRVIPHYVLFSWVYDRFPVLPYLLITSFNRWWENRHDFVTRCYK